MHTGGNHASGMGERRHGGKQRGQHMRRKPHRQRCARGAVEALQMHKGGRKTAMPRQTCGRRASGIPQRHEEPKPRGGAHNHGPRGARAANVSRGARGTHGSRRTTRSRRAHGASGARGAIGTTRAGGQPMGAISPNMAQWAKLPTLANMTARGKRGKRSTRRVRHTMSNQHKGSR